MDKENAVIAGSHLRNFLELVASRSKSKNVHLIAHSMGSYVLLRALKDIGLAKHPEIKFSQVILAAPDVDRSEFLDLVKAVGRIANGTTLYASSTDEAMRAVRFVYKGKYRAGDVPPGGPIVATGVDTIDASALSMKMFQGAHSHYAEHKSLLEDIGLLFREGARPPHDRTPILGRRRAGAQWYWVYPPDAVWE